MKNLATSNLCFLYRKYESTMAHIDASISFGRRPPSPHLPSEVASSRSTFFCEPLPPCAFARSRLLNMAPLSPLPDRTQLLRPWPKFSDSNCTTEHVIMYRLATKKTRATTKKYRLNTLMDRYWSDPPTPLNCPPLSTPASKNF